MESEELSERVLARLRREYSLVSSEVWVDDVHRVDFVGFRPARKMVNHSAYSYRTSRGVFSNGYCPWCSPYRAKLLNDIDDVCGDMDLIEGIELALEVNDPQGVHLSMSHDNGIDCAYIPINYCPICGRNFRKDR